MSSFLPNVNCVSIYDICKTRGVTSSHVTRHDGDKLGEWTWRSGSWLDDLAAQRKYRSREHITQTHLTHMSMYIIIIVCVCTYVRVCSCACVYVDVCVWGGLVFNKPFLRRLRNTLDIDSAPRGLGLLMFDTGRNDNAEFPARGSYDEYSARTVQFKAINLTKTRIATSPMILKCIPYR